MSTPGSTRAVIAALLANIGIAVTKFAAWAVTGAASMLAEAIHSVADSGNQALLLFGGKRSKRAATPKHPFGFGPERYLYGFIVSVVLFSVGGLFSLYEAYHKYQEVAAGHPDQLLDSSWWWVPVAVLSAAIVMESVSFRTAIVEANKLRNGAGWRSYVRDAKAPELPVVLLEDLAALVGLTFALLGVGLTLLTENAYFDVLGAAAIGVLLVSVAVILAVETQSLLIGEAASQPSLRSIEGALQDTPGVTRVIHLKTLHLGPDQLLVAAKIGVPADRSAAAVAGIIDDAERRIRHVEPLARVIYLEPDIARDETSDTRPEPRRLPAR